MNLEGKRLYHIYNRGINRQMLFYDREYYLAFIKKIKRYIAPHCDLLAYCLMSNHFHLLVQANEKTFIPFRKEDTRTSDGDDSYIRMNCFSHGMKMLLSSYTKVINKRNKRSGSLFRQNTRSKQTSGESLSEDYSVWCFIYIHNNPVASGLVAKPEDWTFSSYGEYFGNVQHPICNVELGRKILSLDLNEMPLRTVRGVPDHIKSKFL